MQQDWLQRLKQSVARVEIPADPTGESFVPNGTAFLISRTLVVTCLHVLAKHEQVRLTFSEWVTDANRNGKVVWKHPDGTDLAILQMDRPCGAEVPFLPVGALPATSTLWSTFGYPKNVPGGHTLTDEKLVDPLKALPSIGRVLQLEAAVATESFIGFSGAPCVVKGTIVGILSFQLERVREDLEQTKMTPSLRALYALPVSLLKSGPLGATELRVVGSQEDNTQLANKQPLIFEDLVVLFAEKDSKWNGNSKFVEELQLPRARLPYATDPLIVWYHVLLRTYRTKKLLVALERASRLFGEDHRLVAAIKQCRRDPKSLAPAVGSAYAHTVTLGALSLLGLLLLLFGFAAGGVVRLQDSSAVVFLTACPVAAAVVVLLRSVWRGAQLETARAERAAEGLVRRQRRSAFRWLAPYDDGDLLPGAARRATGLVVATQLVSDDFSLGVLSGVVGCGKTSFLRSELKPRLVAAGATVLLVARPRELDSMSTPSECEVGGTTERLQALETLVAERASTARLFLFIDQFEEFFVDDPAPETIISIREVFARLTKANVRILCAIRHDFLLHMHRLSPMLPPLAYQRNLFELREFDSVQAEDVIRDCAEEDDLKIRPPSLAKSIAEDLANGKGRTVRPPELQIVCGSLVHDFSEKYYRRNGSAAGLIANYIKRAIEMNSHPRIAARVLRQLCDFAPTVRNTKPPQSAATIASGIEEPKNVVQLTLETLELECVVRRVDHERFVLMHDYLVDPVARATRTETTAAEEAEQLLRYHLSAFSGRRPEAIPLRRMIFVYRNAPQVRRREKDALNVLRRSVRIHALTFLKIALLGLVAFWIPEQFAPSSCPVGHHLRGRWAARTCVLDYSWQLHTKVEGVADGVKSDGNGFEVCRVEKGNGKQVGYLSSTGCHYEFGNKYYVSTIYEALLGPTEAHWGEAEAGKFPVNALSGGSEDGHPRLVCRAKREGTMVSGKTVGNCCSIAGEDPSSAVPRGLPGICPERFEVLLDD